ncbi:hypothetical protein PV325_006147 [Microctonus aethiopoides]|nr:hypothetical protein PV325_006147 [Microctonus aethiopoides]
MNRKRDEAHSDVVKRREKISTKEQLQQQHYHHQQQQQQQQQQAASERPKIRVHGMSVFSATVKIFCMLIYREDVMNLIKLLDEHFDDLIKKGQLTNLLNGITAFRRLSWTVALGACITATFNCFVPIIFMIIDKTNHVKREVYPLPNHSKLPWASAGTGISYKFEYLFQTMASYSIAVISSGVEPVFSLFVFQMVGRLREITYRIVHIDESNDRDSILRDCTIKYILLLKCRDIIQKVFGPIILQMFISNAVVMSALILQVSQMDLLSWKSLVFIPYTITKFAQTYLCALAGARLTAEDDVYRDAVYAANWQGDKRFSTFVMVTLVQKPLMLVSCHFAIISLNIFVSVLNTTISYYFLLQTLQKDE